MHFYILSVFVAWLSVATASQCHELGNCSNCVKERECVFVLTSSYQQQCIPRFELKSNKPKAIFYNLGRCGQVSKYLGKHLILSK